MTYFRSQHLFFLLLASALFAISGPGIAGSAPTEPLESLGRAVEVTEYPIGEGERDTFAERRESTFTGVLEDVKGSYGEPLITDSVGDTHVLLVYPEKFVAISGHHSNTIICRVEIEAPTHRLGFDAGELVSMAALACRKSEEDGWGGSGLTQLTPIGIGRIPELGGIKSKVYLSDRVFALFPSLVREVEALSQARASLIRRRSSRERLPRGGERVWQYAWFENGALLVLGYKEPQNRGRRFKRVLACAALIQKEEISSFSEKPFSTWCEAQSDRLTPRLDEFFDAVRKFRIELPSEFDPDKRQVPSMYSGFHFGQFPKELTEAYWQTGEVEKD